LDIKDFLAPADVIVDMRATDKEQLLLDLSRRGVAALGLDVELVTAEILKREELGSTGMGEGIAIPHARIPKLDRPFGILARLKKAIDFAAIDEKPVDLVFLLLLPGATEGDQLNALASVARMLRNPVTSSAIRAARNGAEAYEAIATS
jgi:PTS system nitrogen regulatory IIA component